MAAKSYNIQEALKFVLEPNSDSELSDLSDGEDEDNFQQVTVQLRSLNLKIKWILAIKKK